MEESLQPQIIKVERLNPNINIGLTKKQVKSRIEAGLVNVETAHTVKTVPQIIKSNIFTLFNFINTVIALAILWTGSYRNLLFMGVIICNSIIGIVQEIRAKTVVERLNLFFSNTATLIREGRVGKTKIEKVVLDDIICYSGGNQVIADSIVKDGVCEVNESLLTGEPDLIQKRPGDMLLSGSYIASGNCIAQVERVGDQNYSASIMKESKKIKKTKSEIMSTVKKIIQIISVAIFPIGIILFNRQLNAFGGDLKQAIITTSATLTGMIPEGLVLLTSSILAVGVMKLSKKKVLVQDIYCIETLARIDTLCLDKTGTLTQGTFEVSKVLPENGFTETDVKKALSKLTGVLSDTNETFKTIYKMFPPDLKPEKADKIISFSSEKKWSGAHFKCDCSYVMGAAEFIFGEEYSHIREKIAVYSSDYRVLALARSSEEFTNEDLPKGLQLIAFLLIKDKIRTDAEKTLAFFEKQDVDIKVISGDNPVTVSKIGERVGLKNAHFYVDASTLKTYEMIKDAATRYTVFGRVTPIQKQEIIKALKEAKRTVAMVGDGVNDILALKEADCSIAMATGSDVARSISHLVLMNSTFSSMPKVVAEGRQAINNIQRSSSLFLTKTIYSFLISLLFFFIPAPLPFIPIQMTLISAVAIGIPSFILALEPNRERIKGSLFRNIVKKALPCALATVFMLVLCVIIFMFNIPEQRYRLLTLTLTGFIGILLIRHISEPLNILRKIVLYGVGIIFSAGIIFFPKLFVIEPLNWLNVLLLLVLMPISWVVYEFFTRLNFNKNFKNWSLFKRKKAKI